MPLLAFSRASTGTSPRGGQEKTGKFFFDLEKFLAGSFGIYHGKGDIVVRVRFAPSAARYVSEKRMHTSQHIEPQRDGSALAEWRVSSTVEIKSYILSFGSAAEVLQPPELRDEIRAELERLAITYSTNAQHVERSSPRRTRIARQTEDSQ